MGAGLPAIAVDQAIPSQQVYRYRRQASSHRGLHFKSGNARSHALRGNAAWDALRPQVGLTQSVTGCIPLLRVGTIKFERSKGIYCGSWLACDGGGSVGRWVADTPLSQASQLPQGIAFQVRNKKGDLSKVAFCYCAYCLLNPGGTPCTSVSSHGPFGLMERLQPLLQR